MGAVGSGHVIAGKYRLDHRLGEGGMGSVWSAEHLDLRSKVAIKLIIPDYAEDPSTLARFVREARAAAALRSPHVVQILDYGVDEGLAYIAMEQLEGESLADRLRREKPLPAALTATIITHVARAIGKAHEAGLVHRDLKPDNIFLVHNDDEIVAKVLDFGIAKSRPGGEEGPVSTRTETGAVIGSPFYMSPEQARGRRDVDYRSDLWAIGVIAYECLTGARPFSGDSLGEVILMICTEPVPVPSATAAVPVGFDEWFTRATERDVARRFQSAKEMAASIRRVLVPSSEPSSDASIVDVSAPAAAPVPASDDPDRTRVDGEPAEEAVRAESGESLGSTTTGPTSHEKRPAVVSAPAAPKPQRRLGAMIGIGALILGGLAWLSGGSKSPVEPAGSAERPLSPSPPEVETEVPAAIVPTPPAVVPAPAGATPAVVAAESPAASASAQRVKVQSAAVLSARPASPKREAPKAAPSATGPKANPLDIRF